MSKISSLRGKKDATESKYATPFVLFALKQEEASVIDDIVVQFKLSEKEKESDDATVAQDEELEEDLLLEDSPNDNAYSPASSPIPVPATTADDGGAEAAAIATTDSAEQPGTPLVKKSKGFIPMQSKKVGTFQIPKNNSNSNSNTSNLSPPADVVKAKKVIPMVAKKAIAAANEKKAKRDASKVSFSKSASKEKSSSKPNKAKKDPLAPKKAVNAYMFFAAKQRAGKLCLSHTYLLTQIQ